MCLSIQSLVPWIAFRFHFLLSTSPIPGSGVVGGMANSNMLDFQTASPFQQGVVKFTLIGGFELKNIFLLSETIVRIE